MTHYIINLKTMEYVCTEKETFEGDWRLNYEHVKPNHYADILAASIHYADEINGIPFIYDLHTNGIDVTLLADKTKFDQKQIKEAKIALRKERDVLCMRTYVLKPV